MIVSSEEASESPQALASFRKFQANTHKMSHFTNEWAKVELLQLKAPLAQLGLYLRSQPNTGVEKQNFADSPSELGAHACTELSLYTHGPNVSMSNEIPIVCLQERHR